ncbi:hypothetical protein AAGV37_19015 [Pseudomonas protegens]|uniref:hypothetical protein n=1 Tax=Pseudomonas protegens TaxID=380021 RepID=UPI0031593B9C
MPEDNGAAKAEVLRDMQLNDLELKVLMIFRGINGQQQRDVLRVLEAFLLLKDI